jgi:hypothetical protein
MKTLKYSPWQIAAGLAALMPFMMQNAAAHGMGMHSGGHAFGRFGGNRGNHFFHHNHRFFVFSSFGGFGYPWWYLDDYYFYPSDYVEHDGPMYDRQYWTDLAVAVQSELARRGYYHGAVNGTLDPGSRKAIRAFQASHGLPVNGLLSPKLFEALGID